MLEGRPFVVWTDHKPLCGALASSAEKSPRQTRHLSFISEFTTDLRHVAGSANVVADTLSRPPMDAAAVDDPTAAAVAGVSADSCVVEPAEIARSQAANMPEMEDYISNQDPASGLRLQWCLLPDGQRLLCDTSLAPAAPRPVVPAPLVLRLLDGAHLSLIHI